MQLVKWDFYENVPLLVMKNLQVGLVNEEGRVMMVSDLFMIFMKSR